MHSSTRLRRGVALGLLAAMAVSVSACGSGDEKTPSAKDAWTKAQKRVGSYQSMHVKGAGKDEKHVSISIEAEGKTHDDTSKATLSRGNAKAETVTVGGTAYLKANKAFYTGTGEAPLAGKLADTWVKAPDRDSSESVLKDLTTDITKSSGNSTKQLTSNKATVTKDSVDGHDAWKITGADKKVVAWVSRDGKYDLLKARGVGDDAGTTASDISSFTVLGHDTTSDIKAPAGAKTVQQLLGMK